MTPQGLDALYPTTGALLWRDPHITNVHWQSPILVNGVLYVTDQTGIVSAYSTQKSNNN